jgi:hypothetical protein
VDTETRALFKSLCAILLLVIVAWASTPLVMAILGQLGGAISPTQNWSINYLVNGCNNVVAGTLIPVSLYLFR